MESVIGSVSWVSEFQLHRRIDTTNCVAANSAEIDLKTFVHVAKMFGVLQRKHEAFYKRRN